MKSPVVKRSIVVAGHKTSVSLEEAFWNGMKEISGLRNMTLSELVGEIDSNRQQGNRSLMADHSFAGSAAHSLQFFAFGFGCCAAACDMGKLRTSDLSI